jgi:hypothetical protein
LQDIVFFYPAGVDLIANRKRLVFEWFAHLIAEEEAFAKGRSRT